MNNSDTKPALLTKTELEWLLGRVKVSKTYQYRIKSDLKKKLKTFTELEIPLLIKKGIIDSSRLRITTQNLMISPQTNSHSNSQQPTNNQFQYRNMVGREGFEPSNPAMSRRYLNQARPPARFICCMCQALKFRALDRSNNFILAIINVII